MTDEELEAELAKLTPEEREELVKHLEAKESGALSGQASRQLTQKVQTTINAKKVSPTVMKVSSVLAKRAITKLAIFPVCTDSDGLSLYTFGVTSANKFLGVAGNVILLSDKIIEYNDQCQVLAKAKAVNGDINGIMHFPVSNCNDVSIGSTVLSDGGATYLVEDIKECDVLERVCGSALKVKIGELSFSDVQTINSVIKTCSNGCFNGACLPETAIKINPDVTKVIVKQ